MVIASGCATSGEPLENLDDKEIIQQSNGIPVYKIFDIPQNGGYFISKDHENYYWLDNKKLYASDNGEPVLIDQFDDDFYFFEHLHDDYYLMSGNSDKTSVYNISTKEVVAEFNTEGFGNSRIMNDFIVLSKYDEKNISFKIVNKKTFDQIAIIEQQNSTETYQWIFDKEFWVHDYINNHINIYDIKTGNHLSKINDTPNIGFDLLLQSAETKDAIYLDDGYRIDKQTYALTKSEDYVRTVDGRDNMLYYLKVEREGNLDEFHKANHYYVQKNLKKNEIVGKTLLKSEIAFPLDSGDTDTAEGQMPEDKFITINYFKDYYTLHYDFQYYVINKNSGELLWRGSMALAEGDTRYIDEIGNRYYFSKFTGDYDASEKSFTLLCLDLDQLDFDTIPSIDDELSDENQTDASE